MSLLWGFLARKSLRKLWFLKKYLPSKKKLKIVNEIIVPAKPKMLSSPKPRHRIIQINIICSLAMYRSRVGDICY